MESNNLEQWLINGSAHEYQELQKRASINVVIKGN